MVLLVSVHFCGWHELLCWSYSGTWVCGYLFHVLRLLHVTLIKGLAVARMTPFLGILAHFFIFIVCIICFYIRIFFNQLQDTDGNTGRQRFHVSFHTKLEIFILNE